jgi:hypothetical protein
VPRRLPQTAGAVRRRGSICAPHHSKRHHHDVAVGHYALAPPAEFSVGLPAIPV